MIASFAGWWRTSISSRINWWSSPGRVEGLAGSNNSILQVVLEWNFALSERMAAVWELNPFRIGLE